MSYDDEPMKISAFVITYNEEKRISDCLRSLSFCDEIVVVDSYSDDKTVEIVKQFTDNIFLRKFDNYSDQRKYAVQQCHNDWILWLDADEIISDLLRKEILSLSFHYDSYILPRQTNYLGRWIKHCGWYPDYHIRLFNRNKFYINNNLVHEGITGNGEIGKIKNHILHYSYGSLRHHLHKMNKYTTLYADGHFDNSNIIITIIKMIFGFKFKFFKMYFIHRGFLDGIQGLILSLMSAFYVFLKYAKIIEKKL